MGRSFMVLTFYALGMSDMAFAFQPAFRTKNFQSTVSAARPWWKPFGAVEGGSDITTSKVFLEKKIEILKKDKATLDDEYAAVQATISEETEEWGQQIKNLNAEFSFLQQRTFNETRDADVTARVDVVKELLPVLDNFDRAAASLSGGNSDEEAIIAYYGGIRAQITQVLETFELLPVPSVGTPFDYNLHEAIQSMPSEYDEDLVCQEYQKGYMIGDKLVRPAVVAVSLGS